MQHLNSGYLQLGVLALLFGGLQVWWIGSILQKRDLARPLSDGEFRKSLERIWVSKSRRLPGLPPQRLPDPPGNHCHHFTLAN